MGTIPARIDSDVTPGVVGAGGTALDAIGLFLDNSPLTPIDPLGALLSFPSAAAVEDYYGLGSSQAAEAEVYFSGFLGRTAIPSAMLFAQYPTAPVAAYLRGGPLVLSLIQLQALTGSLTVIMDGYSHVISSINLVSYSSFSAMAAAITAAFTDPTESSFTGAMGASFTATAGSPNTKIVITVVTGFLSVGDTLTGTGLPANTTILSQDAGGTPGGAGTYNLSGANTTSSASCTSTSSVLNVTVCASPTIEPGQTLSGGSVQVGTIITSQIAGAAGGVGQYQTRLNGLAVNQATLSGSLTGSATAPVVTYSSLFGAFVVTSGITGAGSLSAYATGTLAGSVALTQTNGAILSQGAVATTPAAFMPALIAQDQNFLSFSTTFDPDAAFFTGTISTTNLTVDQLFSGNLAIGDTVTGPGVTANTVITGGSGTAWTIFPSQTVSTSVNMKAWQSGGVHGNTQKLAFAAWNNAQSDQYLYAGWDTDISPTLSPSATGSFGYQVTTSLQYEGTVPIWVPDNAGYHHAAFLMGSIASINFSETNGRTNMKFRTQGGLVPSVTDETIVTNLGSGEEDGPNGYNCVGAIGTAKAEDIYWRNGQISGQFDYIDSYVNQIWLNRSIQAADLDLLKALKSIPYNQAGYDLIAGAITGGAVQPIQLPPASPVAYALNFGAIRANVPLSAAQAEEVNNAAGTTIDNILSTRGWYLQVLAPDATVRAARGSPIINFWYTDGGSINRISLASVAVQ